MLKDVNPVKGMQNKKQRGCSLSLGQTCVAVQFSLKFNLSSIDFNFHAT